MLTTINRTESFTMKDFEKLSREHFDRQAAIYDERETMYYSKLPKFSCHDTAARLQNIRYRKLLDVGCGTGYLIELLKKQNQYAAYYGLDISPEMLKIAQQRFDGGVELTEGSSSSLPYRNQSFDVVTCIQSFHHYPEPEKAMSEAFRVLLPGGIYLLSDTGCSGFFKWFDNHIFLPLLKSGDYAVYSVDDIRGMMQSAGFTVRTAEKLSRYVYTVIGVKPAKS